MRFSTSMAMAVAISVSLPPHDAAFAQGTPIMTHAGSPRVSPDGGQILFSSNRDGSSAIYVMHRDGTQARRVTSDAACCAAWFPDGKRIVFTAFGASPREPARIVVMGLDRGDRQELASGLAATWPNVSPDAATIAYQVMNMQPGQRPTPVMQLIPATGGAPRALEAAPGGLSAEPTWGPDGQLAFPLIQMDSGGNVTATTIFVMRADGSDRRALATVSGFAQRLAWSRDGSRIAFQAADVKAHDCTIDIVETQTGRVSVLTRHTEPVLDESPDWLPDGKAMVFQSNRSGRTEIYEMALDGSGITLISRG